MHRVILPLVVLAATACQPGAVPLSDDDIAAIRDLGYAYARANLAKDADAVVAVYADDAMEMPPNEAATVGKAAIRARYASWFQADVASIEFTINPAEIVGADGLAYARGTWTWTGVPPGMTDHVSEAGKHLAIARRQEDGSWLWTVAMWNSDPPSGQQE
jgi:uncharacterized protein (TIGR02246 family)